MKANRTLCVTVNARGLGYTIIDEGLNVVTKEMITITPVSNTKVLEYVSLLIEAYLPSTLVLKSLPTSTSSKWKRKRKLYKLIHALCKRYAVEIIEYNNEQIDSVFSLWNAKTRYERAEVIAQNIKGFKYLLFNQPKYPITDHYYFGVFESVVLGVIHDYNSMEG